MILLDPTGPTAHCGTATLLAKLKRLSFLSLTYLACEGWWKEVLKKGCCGEEVEEERKQQSRIGSNSSLVVAAVAAAATVRQDHDVCATVEVARDEIESHG